MTRCGAVRAQRCWSLDAAATHEECDQRATVTWEHMWASSANTTSYQCDISMSCGMRSYGRSSAGEVAPLLPSGYSSLKAPSDRCRKTQKKKKKNPKKPAKLLSGSPVSLPGDRQSEKKKATTTESTCGHDLHISVVDERPAPRSLQRIVKEIL